MKSKTNGVKFVYLLYCRNVPVWSTPDEIQVMAHSLSGRRFDHEFLQWFLPQYTRGRGTQNMTQLVYSAAEFFIDLFCDVWGTLGQTNSIPKGRRKNQVCKYSGIF